LARQRYLNTSFWSDNYISEELEPIEKLIYIYLLTNERTNISGIYEISHKRISFDTGVDLDTTKKIVKKFEDKGKIKFFNGLIAIKNFIKHQSLNPKICKGIANELEKAPQELIDFIECNNKEIEEILNNKVKFKRKKIRGKLRLKIMQRDHYKCQICGKTKDDTILEIDHIIPVSKGGETREENLRVLCQECNASKNNNIISNSGLPIDDGGLSHINNNINNNDNSNAKGDILSPSDSDDPFLEASNITPNLVHMFARVREECMDAYEHIEQSVKTSKFANHESVFLLADYMRAQKGDKGKGYLSEEKQIRYLELFHRACQKFSHRVVAFVIKKIVLKSEDWQKYRGLNDDDFEEQLLDYSRDALIRIKHPAGVHIYNPHKLRFEKIDESLEEYEKRIANDDGKKRGDL
jgi:hypothetical protein